MQNKFTEKRKNPTNSKDEFILLRGAFAQFEANSKKLEEAYLKMQKDFGKLNIELDNKNDELKKTLEDTLNTRERLNCILESIKTGVVVIDVEGRITHFNKAAEMTGYKMKEAIGNLYEKTLFHGGNYLGIMDTLKKGLEIKNEERDLISKNQRTIPVNYSTSIVKDGAGKIIGAVEVFHDISNVKMMEQEVQHAKTLSALGEMSATVAHEIRNPLGGIGTYAALLERDLAKDDPRRNLVINIMQGIASLNKIVTNLLVYTRPMQGLIRRVALNEIVREIGDFALLEIEEQHKGITIDYKFPKKELYCKIDPEKMQQMLLNIIFNAAHAMPNGGVITISLNQKKSMPDKKPGLWNGIIVKDCGIGISADKIEKIFNPFYTTKENGTGLGLAIVKKISEFHKGVVKVKSKLTKGTVFELYFPNAD